MSYVQDAAAATGAVDLQPGQTNDNYTYDVIGNLKTDRQEGIKAIEWNSYGKMSRLVKGTAQEDTLTMVFHYDGMGNRIRKDVWTVAQGSSGGTQERASDIYTRDAQGNILAVYKEHARVNGGATIDWLNSQLYQVAHSNEIATFLSSQYGSNGTFTNNLYGYSLANNPEWAQEKLSNLNAEYYFNNSNYIFNHVLETQLAESWSQLREIDPGELLPLFKDSSKDLEQTGRLISVALQSDQTVVATLQHLSNADDDFVMSLFSSLPDGYKTDYPEEALDLGAEKRQDRLRSLMGAHGTDPIGVAFADASRSASPEVFLTNWIYDDNIFNTSNLEGDNELRKTLKPKHHKFGERNRYYDDERTIWYLAGCDLPHIY